MPYPCLAHVAKLPRILTAALTLAGIALSLPLTAHAQTETTIYNFANTGPYAPQTGPVMDKAGSLYGVTPSGGTGSNGVVYKLTPVSGGWQESVIYTFTGSTDGGRPSSTPIFDASGNLYGTTEYGGDINSSNCYSVGCGVVYKLTPTSSGEWTETTLYAFTGGKDGGFPVTGTLVLDAAGNLYGSNIGGGNLTTQSCQNTTGCGVIFQLSPVATGKWKISLLHTFTGGGDGVGPAGLVFSPSGTLFGSAAGAWSGWELPSRPGLIFQLTPTASGPWTDTVVYAFKGGVDGGLPTPPVFDHAGNIYGSGADGGILNNCWSGYGPMGCGVVFKLSPTAGGQWKETTLYQFTGGSDGNQPDGGLVFDKGNLYGTAWSGGAPSGQCPGSGCGVVFELKQQPGGGWNETVAHSFVGTDGSIPESKLVMDKAGNLYGITSSGGAATGGVVFEITP